LRSKGPKVRQESVLGSPFNLRREVAQQRSAFLTNQIKWLRSKGTQWRERCKGAQQGSEGTARSGEAKVRRKAVGIGSLEGIFARSSFICTRSGAANKAGEKAVAAQRGSASHAN
jgi:hypothetical protein